MSDDEKRYPLDVILRAWHDTSVPTKTIKFLDKKFPLEHEANQRIEDATVRVCAAVADAIDAFRLHPNLTYGNALTNLKNMIGNLPEPEQIGTVPEGIALTPDERLALESGNGDRPIGA